MSKYAEQMKKRMNETAQMLQDLSALLEEQQAHIAYLEAEHKILYAYNKTLYDYILEKTGSPPPNELLPKDDTTGLLHEWGKLERENERKVK